MDEAIEPFLRGLKKRLKVGRVEEAGSVCMAIVLGLYRASQSKTSGGAIGEIPEWPGEAAEEAIELYRGHRSRPKPPEPPPFPESFWRRVHGGWSDTLAW